MVEYLEAFDKKFPVRIGYYVMKKVKEETGMPFGEALQKVEETGDIELHETILWYALRMGAYAEDGSMDKVKIEREEVPMLLDACFAEYLSLFQSETFFPEKLQEMAEQNTQRLEQNGKKSAKQKRTKKPQS